MPSPFPGMDPYLENPNYWPDIHHGLISEIQATLNQTVRPKYYVRVEERVYVSDDQDPGRRFIIPDVRVADSGRGTELSAFPAVPGGATAVAEVAEPVVVTTLLDEEIHDAYLEVIDRESRQVVTVIEVLSPTNKCAGSRGRAAYQRKRAEVMQSPTHLVEIDLLRQGEVFITREMLPPYHYLVHVSRVEKRPQAKVWPILLRQRLPVIVIPLRGVDPDAPLDLQAVLSTAYDRAAYDLVIDYTQAPTPPLPENLHDWGKTVTNKTHPPGSPS